MRKITNWTDDETAEFNNYTKYHNLKNGAIDIMGLVADITWANGFPALSRKYTYDSNPENISFAQDIIDLINGDAEFPKQKYSYMYEPFSELDGNTNYWLKKSFYDGSYKIGFGKVIQNKKPFEESFKFTRSEFEESVPEKYRHDFAEIDPSVEVPADD